MPTFKITDPKTGQSFRVTGDSAPKESEISEIFGTMTKKADEGSLIKGLGSTITKEKAQDLLKSDVPGKTTFAQRIGATGEPELRTPFGLPEQAGAFATGFAEGSSLGLANLDPRFKREKEMAEKFPKTKAAGEISSFLVPGSAPAKVFGTGGKVASKVLPKAAPLLQKAAGAGLGGFATGAIRGTVEEGGFDPVQGLKTGTTEGITSAVLTAGFEKLAPALKNKAADFAQSVIKPLKANTRQNFSPQRIFDLGVDGTLKETIKKSGKKIATLSQQLDDTIDDFAKANPDARFDIDGIIDRSTQKVASGKGKGIKAGEFEQAKKAINSVIGDLRKTGVLPKGAAQKPSAIGLLSGQKPAPQGVDINQLRTIKNKIGEIAFERSRGFETGDIVKREALRNLWVDVMDEFSKAVPKAKGLGKDIADLKVIEDTVEQAIQRIGNKDQIGLGDLVLLAGKGALAKGTFLARKAAGGGRGVKATAGAAELAKKPGFQRGATRTGTKILDLFKPKEDREQTGSIGRNF
jgi:hypothetical protein